jgi:hypothetical protein
LKTTGIQTVDGSGELYNGYGLDGVDIWTPAARGHYNYKGEDITVTKQADYVNHIKGTAINAYRTEANITVPYLCRFRRTQAGTDLLDNSGRGRWQNLALGNTITFGTGGSAVHYTVAGIERDSQSKETKIKMLNSSLIPYSTAAGLLTAVNSAVTAEPSPMMNLIPAAVKTASGGIKKYNILTLTH